MKKFQLLFYAFIMAMVTLSFNACSTMTLLSRPRNLLLSPRTITLTSGLLWINMVAWDVMFKRWLKV